MPPTGMADAMERLTVMTTEAGAAAHRAHLTFAALWVQLEDDLDRRQPWRRVARWLFTPRRAWHLREHRRGECACQVQP